MLKCRCRAIEALAAEFVNLVGRRLFRGELTDQGMQPDVVALQSLGQAGVVE